MTRGTQTLGVFLLLFLTYSGFTQAATWGAAARFDLARALVEQRTLRIDDYQDNTGDKAFLDGHYYSDKAPLPSFLAAPGIALAHGIRAVTGKPTSAPLWLALAAGLATIGASGLVTAIGGAVFFTILRDRGASYRLAWTVTFLVFLGTTLFPYATVLQGHAPAAAWLLIFFHTLFPATGSPSACRSLVAGGAASAALATEYLTGPPLVAMALLALLHHRSDRARLLVTMGVGALPGLMLLGAYHARAFGSPFALGYQHVALPFFQEKMSTGLFGIGRPDLVVAARLLFGPYRGLFVACPVLLLALPGLVSLLRDGERRAETLAALGVPVFYLLVNAGYSSWHGGWAIGPRHLIPGIPFLALGLGVTVPRWRRAAAVLGSMSVLFMLAATAVQPEVPEDIRRPLIRHVLPHFVRGEFSIGEQGFGDLYPARADPRVPDRWDAFLLGEVVRLPGHLALLPIVLVWCLFSPPVWERLHRPRGAAPTSELPAE